MNYASIVILSIKIMLAVPYCTIMQCESFYGRFDVLFGVLYHYVKE